MDYEAFIAGKFVAPPPAGFDWPADRLPAALFPWQRKVVGWALGLGRAALFADTGLGKSLMELAWAGAVAAHASRPVLLLTPLAVGPQFVREAAKFGVPGVSLAASQADVAGPGVYVTNYQKLDKFDAGAFAGVVLDESSILKSFTGSTKRALCEAFRATPYRLAGTATPAPNDHMELGNHSAFLGVMDSDEMLTRWFINDQSEAGVYRLKKHAEDDYWRWVASWACCVGRPSDLGDYDDAGYDLPPLETVEHVVAADLSAAGVLFRADKLSATTLHREKRRTAAARAAKVAELVASEPTEPWLLWCDTDYEADALLAAIPGAVDVRGSQSERVQADRLEGFASGRYRVLIGKPVQCGFGLNWQHCARMAFVGVSYSWEQWYQAVRRCWRFGQQRPVRCHVVCAETECGVLDDRKRKAAGNDRLRAAMVRAARTHWAGGDARRALSDDAGAAPMRLPDWLVTVSA